MLPLAFGFGNPTEIAIIGAVVLLLFGGSKLAGFGKSLGEGIKEFKKATNDDDKPAAPPAISAAAYPEPPVSAVSRTEDK